MNKSTDFGKILKSLRRSRNITQEQLAKQLNVSRPTIAGYETKNKQPDYDKLKKISDIFNVSIDYLLTGSQFSPCPEPNCSTAPPHPYTDKQLEHLLLEQVTVLSYESRLDLMKYAKLLTLGEETPSEAHSKSLPEVNSKKPE